MQGKKILYVWQSSYPWEIRVEKITEALVKAGAEVSILCRKKTALKINPQIKLFDLSHRRLNAAVPFSPVWTAEIKQIIASEKVDLIIARDILVSPSAIRAASAMGIPVLMDMAEHYPAAMKGWKKYRQGLMNYLLVHKFNVAEKVEQFAINNMNGIITVCLEQEQRLQKLGAQAKNLCAVYNTPILENFPQPEFTKAKKIRHFAHHGFLTPERGLDTLIRAFSILRSQGHDVELTLAGNGESESELLKIATETQAPVHFTGRYQFSEFAGMLAKIDVGILPYQLSEFLDHTVANKLFDYMAAGKPVLVSNTKSLKRIVTETNSGNVIDVRSPELLAESILAFMNSTSGREGLAGRIAVEQKYNWAHDEKVLITFVEGYL